MGHCVLPLLAGRREGIDEAVGKTKLDVELCLLLNGTVLLCLSLVELTLKIRNESVQFRDLVLNSLELGVCIFDAAFASASS